eukprot:gnl/MRDRNA2_/MRDRNA2_15005_c0_seq1.p1 gnl/MRDRNA2_/MRDRNA2_15005_c0~~gnl/MRDRNA2_/MRDRNA2_15005_c0_seq1.p1  ORF type:complete len:422 (-),score=92.93 gnl/MRDRNA2_/MRDRNA2_15005_c0_seq1:5-1270(-)
MANSPREIRPWEPQDRLNDLAEVTGGTPCYQLGADDSGSSDASEEPHSEDALGGPGSEGTLAFTFEANPAISSQESGLLDRVIALCKGLQKRAEDYQRTTEKLLLWNNEYKMSVEQLLQRHVDDQSEIKFMQKLLAEYETMAAASVEGPANDDAPPDIGSLLKAETRGASKEKAETRATSKESTLLKFETRGASKDSTQPLMSVKEAMQALQMCEQHLQTKYQKERCKRKKLQIEQQIALEEKRVLQDALEKQEEQLRNVLTKYSIESRETSLDSYEMDRLFNKAPSIDSTLSSGSRSTLTSDPSGTGQPGSLSRSGRPTSKSSYRHLRARVKDPKEESPPTPSFLQSLMGSVAGGSAAKAGASENAKSGMKEGSKYRSGSSGSTKSAGSRTSSLNRKVTWEDGRIGDSSDGSPSNRKNRF